MTTERIISALRLDTSQSDCLNDIRMTSGSEPNSTNVRMTSKCDRRQCDSTTSYSSTKHLLSNRTLMFTTYIQIIFLLAHLSRLSHAQLDVLPQQYQHNNILYFSVEENKPNNTYIGTIRSSDGQVPYLVVPSPQTPESDRKAAFNINYTTGDLTTNSVLDREHREQYHFIAIVKEPFAEIKCTVTVKDVNDNAPMFLTSANEPNLVIDMPEGQRGVRKVLPLAVDFDTPQNGIKEFRIISGNTPIETFTLVEHGAPARSTISQNGNLTSTSDDTLAAMMAAGAGNPLLIQQLKQQATVLIPSQPIVQTSTPNQPPSSSSATSDAILSGLGATQQVHSKYLIDLEVNQPLDRENQSSYQLVIEARDGDQSPHFGRLLVTVNVQDINDNDPIFLKKFYECQVNEDAVKGTLLHRVQAYDVDLDANGQVSYYIKRHTSSSQQAGTNSSEYNNEVTTNRFGNNQNTKQRGSQQNVGAQSSSSSSTGNSKTYGTQRSVNMDSQDASVTFGLKTRSAYNSDQLFDIDLSKGEIYLSGQLDYETDQQHELVIEARDHGKPYRSSQTTVIIRVNDVPDEAPFNSRASEDRRPGYGESKAEPSTRSSGSEFMEPISQPSLNFNNFNLVNWFSQMNSTMLFVIVLVAFVGVAFSVCLIKIKSRQPESDYNDTAGLTLSSNNGQTKPSPNHSTNNLEHSNGAIGDGMVHRYHDHQRRANGSFGGLNINGSIGGPTAKMSRYPYSDSSNLYHNPYPAQQRPRHHSSTSHHMPPDSPVDNQMVGHGGSRGGTMTMMNHHHHPMLEHVSSGQHYPLDHHHHHHHHHPFSGPNHHGTSSLTYAHHHSRAALSQHAHHHQSSHQLSSVHQVMNGISKGGTMNSVGTHNSAHQASGSPMPATPNTTNSSGLPQNIHDALHHSHHNSLLPTIPQSHQVCQLPPTPTNHAGHGSVFPWPPQGLDSGSSCYPGPNGTLHETPGSTMDSCSTPAGATTPQPLDRWLDLNGPAQLVNAKDWSSSYNWDYLEEWTPDYHTLMPMIEASASGSSY